MRVRKTHNANIREVFSVSLSNTHFIINSLVLQKKEVLESTASEDHQGEISPHLEGKGLEKGLARIGERKVHGRSNTIQS